MNKAPSAAPQGSATSNTISDRSRLAFIGALILVSINLRPLLTGLGPVLDSIRDSLNLSGATIGMLITLPILCFGAFAPVAPRLLRYMSPERLILLCMGMLVVGIGVRSLFGSFGLFAGTFIGGASISIIMVLLPSIIKQHFPNKAGPMMGLYSTALCVGASLAAALAVPIENLTGSWHWALAFWLFPVLLAIPFWIPHIPKKQPGEQATRAPLPKLRRNKLAWQITLVMGLQSAIAYCVFGWLPVILIDRGLSPLTAGFVLSVTLAIQLVSSPGAPWLATRGKDQRLVLMCSLGITLVGLIGVFYAPLSWVWVSAFLLGLGMGGNFSLALTLLVLRAPNAQTAAALSGMVQGVGYTIAAIAPLLMGFLHELTGQWHAVAGLFTLLVLGAAYFALEAGRARFVQV